MTAQEQRPEAAGTQPGTPSFAERLDSAALTELVGRVRSHLGEDHEAVEMFARLMATNLPAVARPKEDGTTFVLTGDIPAMWHRDAAAQMRPYLHLCRDDEHVRDLVVGVLRRIVRSIAIDPYANAFNELGDGACHNLDDTDAGPWIWERKYEVDSLCAPIDLAHRLWRATGATDFLDSEFATMLSTILDVWETEQHHDERSPYRFQRHEGPPSDSLVRQGRGSATEPCGLTWSAFRPSDDANQLGYNVPGNMYAVVSLRQAAEISRDVLGDDATADRATRLADEIAAAIEQHGTVEHPRHGRIYAYEVDGRGRSVLLDDANMPSLLSAPLTGYVSPEDPRYLRTRDFVLSPDNPWYHSGLRASGVGSPHTPGPMIWPIALAVEGLTTKDHARKAELLEVLCGTDGGTGRMHESFHHDDDTLYTRGWFSWADAMFCELVLDVCGIPHVDHRAQAERSPALHGAAVADRAETDVPSGRRRTTY